MLVDLDDDYPKNSKINIFYLKRYLQICYEKD